MCCFDAAKAREMPTHRENSPAGEYPLLTQDTLKVAQIVGHQKKTNARFIAVRDGSRKKVRRLWQRGAKYYLQVKPPGERTPRRIPLNALTLTDAKEEMERKKLKIRDGNAPARGRKPMFADYADAYVALLAKSQHSHKRPMTVAGERQAWKSGKHCSASSPTAALAKKKRSASAGWTWI